MLAKTPYDPNIKTLDYTKLRVTSLPTNRRIHIPGPASDPVEVSLAHVKQGID